MKVDYETLNRMQADIKKRVGIYTKEDIFGEKNFKVRPTVNGVPIGNEDMNGTNYLMVYGTGTPSENAAELQAAYDAAKTMPRFIGYLAPVNITYMYAGQTFGTYIEGSPRYYKILVDGLYNPFQMSSSVSVIVTESEAKSVRTTVIVAPGEYNFGASAFVVNAESINIVSLTGNSDVIISSTEKDYEYYPAYGIKVITSNILIKGIDCKTNTFYIESSLNNLICEYCIGGDNSFSNTDGGLFSGTFNHCIGGENSFGTLTTIIGTFNYCTGGNYSFGAFMGESSGTFNNCEAGTYSFGGAGAIASGTFNNCVGGNNSFSHNASGIFTNCKSGENSFGSYGGDASGIFNNCIGGNKSFGRVSSGTFNYCIGGNYSFGSGYDGTKGTASGTFNDCVGGEVSFGSDGTASGIFTNCKGGATSFGSYGGTISGTFNHCIGGDYSFGNYGGTIETSARLYYTRITSGTFPTPSGDGKIYNCIDGDGNLINYPAISNTGFDITHSTTSTYTILPTDKFVTVSGGGSGGNIHLPNGEGLTDNIEVTIKLVDSSDYTIYHSGNGIEGSLGSYELSGINKCITLVLDIVNNKWYIKSLYTAL